MTHNSSNTNWTQRCEPTQTLGGFATERVVSEKGVDWKIDTFCRDVTDRGVLVGVIV